MSRLWTAVKVFFDKGELGSKGSQVNASLLVAASTALTILLIGWFYWNTDRVLYTWLFVLSMWALLHVKKSVGTWGRFEEIDQRDSDFAEEVDKRFDKLEREVASLKAKPKATEDTTTPLVKKKPRKRRKKNAVQND